MRVRSLLLFAAAALTAHAARLTATPAAVNWTYVSGSHNYPSQTVALVSSTGATGYNASAASATGWLLVNAAYVSSSAALSAGAYLIPASPIDQLQDGTYQGTVSLTDTDGNTTVVTVNLTITGNPGGGALLVAPASVEFSSALNGPSQTALVAVTGSTAGALSVSTASGTLAPWVTVAVSGSPGSYILQVTAAPQGLQPGVYSQVLTLRVGASSGSLPVTLRVQAQSTLVASPARLEFDYIISGQRPQIGLIQVSSNGGQSLQFGATANAEGNWLAVIGGGATPNSVQVIPQVDNVGPGFYSGAVLITPVQGAPLVIPATLTVHPAPLLAVSSPSVSFTYRAGDSAPAPLVLQVTGEGISPNFRLDMPAADWLAATVNRPVAPASLTVAVKPQGLAPGTYNATISLTGTGTARGGVSVAVTLTVLSKDVVISKVANAASYAEGAIAPGEIITLFGTNLAAGSPVSLALGQDGRVATTRGGVQVLFNGVPAPLVYVSATQISAVVPYEVAGRSDTAVVVANNGARSSQLLVPVATTAPGIFTADASGQGPAAATTAPAGGVLTLYLTGEGQTAPAGVTGKVTTVSDAGPLTPGPVLPVSVMLNGQPADFAFAGEAPGLVSGVMQLNLKVPAGFAPGDYPVMVSVGGSASQTGVTVRVQ